MAPDRVAWPDQAPLRRRPCHQSRDALVDLRLHRCLLFGQRTLQQVSRRRRFEYGFQVATRDLARSRQRHAVRASLSNWRGRRSDRLAGFLVLAELLDHGLVRQERVNPLRLLAECVLECHVLGRRLADRHGAGYRTTLLRRLFHGVICHDSGPPSGRDGRSERRAAELDRD